jgi:hypothetical protein
MSVLPSSTTLPSFFIVLALLILITFFTGYLLAPGVRTVKLPAGQSLLRLALNIGRVFYHVLAIPSWVIQEVSKVPLGLTTESRTSWYTFLNPLWLAPYIFLQLPIIILNRVVVPEIQFPAEQWRMRKYIGNRYVNIQWHPLAFVRDAFRLIFIPLWLVLGVAIVAYLSALGLTGAVLYVLLYMPLELIWSRCCGSKGR